MAIAFRAFDSGSATGDDNVTVPVPSGTAEDDLMLFWYFAHDNFSLGSPTLPTGFTEVFSKETTVGSDSSHWLGYKFASGSEPTDYTLNGDDSTPPNTVACIVSYSGVDTGQALDVTFVEATHYVMNENDGTPAPKAITTNTDNAMVLVLAATTSAEPTGYTHSSGYTERVDTPEGTGVGRAILVQEKLVPTAGVETPGDITVLGYSSVADTASVTIALKPAATGINAGVLRRRRN